MISKYIFPFPELFLSTVKIMSSFVTLSWCSEIDIENCFFKFQTFFMHLSNDRVRIEANPGTDSFTFFQKLFCFTFANLFPLRQTMERADWQYTDPCYVSHLKNAWKPLKFKGFQLLVFFGFHINSFSRWGGKIMAATSCKKTRLNNEQWRA